MRDYTKYAFRITFVVVASMLLVSLVPPFSIGGVHFRRTNIVSDLLVFDDRQPVVDHGGLRDTDQQFLEDAALLDLTDTVATPGIDTHNWELESLTIIERHEAETEAETGMAVSTPAGGVRFEDYTPHGHFSVADFGRLLETVSQRRVVRIAFFGDSFIEGDIITGDIREQLQEAYGGWGVGFVPMGTPQAISRPTVRHTFGGWRNYNLIYKKSVPAQYRDYFAVSGSVSVPEGARTWSEYKGTAFRKRLGSWTRARILFTDNGGSTIDVAVNDSIARRFTPTPGSNMQQISLTANGMRSLKVAVDAPNGNFVGYGVVLESMQGVAVDNYAIRSNSGIAMFGTNQQVNTQLGRLLGCDMIVLQWGLNAMETGATDFKAYGAQLRRVINYIKACFPGRVIVVMGVGDRAVMNNGVFTTARSVEAMVREQRAAARACGVAFWDTFAAMGGNGSMVSFVQKGWAAKDYTHLSYRGGKYIATRFVESLLKVVAENQGSDNFRGEPMGVIPHSEVLDLSRATDPLPVIEHTTDSVVERPTTEQRDTIRNIEKIFIDTVRVEVEGEMRNVLRVQEVEQADEVKEQVMEKTDSEAIVDSTHYITIEDNE